MEMCNTKNEMGKNEIKMKSLLTESAVTFAASTEAWLYRYHRRLPVSFVANFCTNPSPSYSDNAKRQKIPQQNKVLNAELMTKAQFCYAYYDTVC